jgi:hypothetical protein
MELTAEEIQRFKDLALLINDETKPIEARTRAQRELTQWVDKTPLERLVYGLVRIAKDVTNRTEVLCEANVILSRLKDPRSPEHICTLFRGFRDAAAVCAKCGQGVSEEAHAPSDFPGMYCRSCCPACRLIPKERLREVSVTAEFAGLLAEHGHADAKPLAREIFRIVRDDHWNISPRAN